MYIAIEGIKGAGKSSVLAYLERHLASMGVRYQLLQPYAVQNAGSWLERAYRRTGGYWPDWAVARFYALRSDSCVTAVPRRSGLLIGDRSIITSYVTRWNDADPIAGMNAVDLLERRIALPDQVILLNSSVDLALRRIAQRPSRCYGRKDEQRERLRSAANAYALLAAEPSRFGLDYVKWHVVDASRSTEQVAADVLRRIVVLADLNHFPNCTIEA